MFLLDLVVISSDHVETLRDGVVWTLAPAEF